MDSQARRGYRRRVSRKAFRQARSWTGISIGGTFAAISVLTYMALVSGFEDAASQLIEATPGIVAIVAFFCGAYLWGVFRAQEDEYDEMSKLNNDAERIRERAEKALLLAQRELRRERETSERFARDASRRAGELETATARMDELEEHLETREKKLALQLGELRLGINEVIAAHKAGRLHTTVILRLGELWLRAVYAILARQLGRPTASDFARLNVDLNGNRATEDYVEALRLKAERLQELESDIEQGTRRLASKEPISMDPSGEVRGFLMRWSTKGSNLRSRLPIDDIPEEILAGFEEQGPELSDEEAQKLKDECREWVQTSYYCLQVFVGNIWPHRFGGLHERVFADDAYAKGDFGSLRRELARQIGVLEKFLEEAIHRAS